MTTDLVLDLDYASRLREGSNLAIEISEGSWLPGVDSRLNSIAPVNSNTLDTNHWSLKLEARDSNHLNPRQAFACLPSYGQTGFGSVRSTSWHFVRVRGPIFDRISQGGTQRLRSLLWRKPSYIPRSPCITNALNLSHDRVRVHFGPGATHPA